jgi:hypothetical protein
LRQIALLWPGGWKGLESGQDMLQEWWNKYGLPLSDGMEQEKYNQSMRDTLGLRDKQSASWCNLQFEEKGGRS